MKKKIKIRMLVALASIVIFLISLTILRFIFKELDFSYIIMIAIFIAVILSPRIKKYKTQTGNKIQVKWILKTQ